jgi:hypothetical protein
MNILYAEIHLAIRLPFFASSIHGNFFILGFCILLRVFYQGYWKNRPSQKLFKVFIYIYFAATCFGPRWPSAGGIHNYIREVILPVVLYGCETWSLTLREEDRLRVFENRLLRRIFGPKRDKVTVEWRMEKIA